MFFWVVLLFTFFLNPFWERLSQLTNIFGKALNHQLVLVCLGFFEAVSGNLSSVIVCLCFFVCHRALDW